MPQTIESITPTRQSTGRGPLARDPRRVAIVYRLDRPGGVQSVALALIRALNRQGIIPDVLWDTPPDSRLIERAGAQVGFRAIRFRVPSLRIDRLPNSLRFLAWIANAYRADRLCVDYDFFYVFHNGFLLPPGAPAVRYLSGPPLLPQLERAPSGIAGLPYRAFKWLYRHLLRRFSPVYEFHRADRYVINSHYTAELFAEAHGQTLPVVHPPINLRALHYDPADLPTRDTITFFSRIVDYKRPEMVLRLARLNTRYRFVIMGGVPAHRRAYFESLQAAAREQKLDNVTFLANPSDEQVREVLARTRYYVFPARDEHFGMTTVEAIAAGCIPFVHDSGGQREIVPDERLRFSDNLFVVRFNQLDAMSNEQLNQLRAELDAHIRQFSEEAFTTRMLAFFDQAAPPKGNA